MARGLSMSGMIKLTPDDRVRWYLPSRSMIIVCACWTMRIPLATIEIATSAIAAGTMSVPMLSISGLLVHVQRRAFDPHHHHPRARLEHRVHERRAAPVLTLHDDPAPAGAGVDPLGHHAHPPYQGVHIGLDLVRGGVDVPQQEGTDADQREQRPGREAQERCQEPGQHQRDHARQHAAPQYPGRHTISGDDIAIYNLAGVMRVEGGSGPGVAVELTRGGRDAGKLRVETGPVRGRETLRVIYPDDAIVYHELDFDG